MSDGQLRMRVRAYEREQPWGPRHVANELAATIQAAAHHRDNATRWAAQADATAQPDERDRLQHDAAGAGALAELLDDQIQVLRELNEERGMWLAHTAGTRAAADRAQAELTARHAGDEAPEQRVTAEEWLAAEQEDRQAEDLHREITEIDLEDDLSASFVEPPPDDLRQIAALEPALDDEHLVRVPSVAETTDAITRARRALVEIRNRETVDATYEAEYSRSAQLARWQEDDRGQVREDDGRVME